MSLTDSIITALKRMQLQGVTYSMTGSRTGSDGTADCSGAIYQGMIEGGCEKLRYPFSTETEHAYLLNNGYELIATNQSWNAKRGDIFIWGMKSASNGGAGHTGIFLDDQNIIHCNYGHNGVSVNNYDQTFYANGSPYSYVYRLKSGQGQQKPSTPPTQTTKWVSENATFIPNQDLPLSKDIDPNSKEVATIKKGQKVKYNAYCVENGYVWIRQPRNDGSYLYMAIAEGNNRVATSKHWGTFA